MEHPEEKKTMDNSKKNALDKAPVKTADTHDCSNEKHESPNTVESSATLNQDSVILTIPDIMSNLEDACQRDNNSNKETNMKEIVQHNVDILPQTNTGVLSKLQHTTGEIKQCETSIKTPEYQKNTVSTETKKTSENGSKLINSDKNVSQGAMVARDVQGSMVARDMQGAMVAKDIEDRVAKATNVKLDVHGKPIFRPKSPAKGRPTSAGPAGKVLIRKETPALLPKLAKLNAKDRFANKGMLEETHEDATTNSCASITEKDKLSIATGGAS